MNHHPDLEISWDTVRSVLSTHSEGGVTAGRLRAGGEDRRPGLSRRLGPWPIELRINDRLAIPWRRDRAAHEPLLRPRRPTRERDRLKRRSRLRRRGLAALTEAQRQCLLERMGPIITAIAQDARGQARNRELAISDSQQRSPPASGSSGTRRPTRPTRSSADDGSSRSAALPPASAIARGQAQAKTEPASRRGVCVVPGGQHSKKRRL